MRALPETIRKRKVYHQTFEAKDKGQTMYRHTLLVNPQEMSVQEPPRILVQQTLGGAYVSHFGEGIHQVTISGTTGYGARNNIEGKLTDGYQEIHDFRRKIYRDFLKSESEQYELFWYNWEDEEYYKIVPSNFRLMRSKSEPILYRYELTFYCIEEVGAGAKPVANPNAISKLNFIDLAGALAQSTMRLTTMTNILSRRGS